ncbi:Hypothetical protein PACV_310 [Pacmanvirus A23]|uniref:Hypothetical protein n=1 Tax=Pacmanvirus A23 TaxID=1932881 RepID=UPI000A095348|nr:Hypothetical protein B9W72_gp306 [Pacmanvirus A23]SIP86023.1 Hypothetical protein PACV_310 [Pacmanvirus A23]
MIYNDTLDNNQVSLMDIEDNGDKMDLVEMNLFNILPNEVLEKIAGYNLNITFDTTYDKNGLYITMYKYDEIINVNIMNFTTINGIVYRQLSNIDIERMVHFIQNINSGVFFKTQQVEFIVCDRIIIKTANCKIQIKNSEKIKNSFRAALTKAAELVIGFPQQPVASLISPRCVTN